MDAIGIFEAIKKSPFFNVIFTLRPFPANASAEIEADAQKKASNSKVRHPTHPQEAV